MRLQATKLSQLAAALLACGGLTSVQDIETSMRDVAGAPERDFRQLIDMVRVRAGSGAVVYPSRQVGERWVSLTAIYADRAISSR